ncbi:16S rRNA (cytidine(1402)-2'-O)-methyltransferase [uncultured Roseovarius sp.]|uniref:16S rRNA (cytidine(1402)-2'-O)-methyltransferase n=1 Tax=uncultured Roseovarius sp. TaxID=293344 RepID=UPI0025F70632|nr:16S rRNA (cytidine(1402)-2'-O)-methyltransferase [uncultured Roseovarius sp.]
MVNQTEAKLSPGLYLVATPIGTARDITLRALDLFSAADVIAAEDTRSLRKLLDIHGIPLEGRPLVAYHDHSNSSVRERLLKDIVAGKSVVYASEAGTPMVADPGYDLVRDAIAAAVPLVSAPGPSAVITALTVSGLPTDRFFFAGFLPNSSGKRKTALRDVARVPGTLAFYESPKRVAAMLRDAAEVLGPARRAVVCRELTKKFEEVLRGTLEELAQVCAERSLKGEIVVLVDRGDLPSVNEADLDSSLRDVLRDKSVRDAADEVAGKLGLKRRQVYQRALQLAHKDAGDQGD